MSANCAFRCGHCQSLAPDWKKAATALKGVVKVGAVNADEHRSLGSQYGVQGFQTIKVFGVDKSKPKDYQGPRSASGIVSNALDEAKSMVNQKLGGKKTGGGGGGGGGSGKQADPDAVVELTDSNFEDLVIKSKDIWMVEFFAPWCGHCKNLAPDWAQAATELKGKVKLGALDATVHTVMASRYGVRGYPTIKYFPGGRKDGEAEEYDGGRTGSDIVNWALEKHAQNVPPPEVYQITNAKVLSDNCDDHQLCIIAVLPHILDCQSKCRNDYIKILYHMGDKYKSKGWGLADPNAVVELTDSNFEDLVIKSEEIWLVEFFAPWCGHCKNLAPHWSQAATELKGKVKLGALDATVHTVMASRYGVRGYPTIKYFPEGKKDGEAEEYDGGRTGSDIVNWALEKHAQNVPPPEVNQITNAKVLSDNCDDHQLCIIAVLPHILNCQFKCRNDYIKILYQMGDKYKSKGWGWMWSEAVAQPKLEQGLEIGGFGYPAVAAINSRKMKFSLMKGAFNEKGISEFLRALSFGRGSTLPVKDDKLPEIVTIEPWDGKDCVLEVEDDIDLSDVELDDLDPIKEEL